MHIAQLMPLPHCCCKIQIGFTFLLPPHPDADGPRQGVVVGGGGGVGFGVGVGVVVTTSVGKVSYKLLLLLTVHVSNTICDQSSLISPSIHLYVGLFSLYLLN